MENVIVVILLVLIVGGAVAYLIRAKKQGVRCVGCPAGGNCPSAGRLPVKKLDGPVIGKKTLKISGMHCDHCVLAVPMVLNRIDGVRAEVNLSRGKAVVSFDREIPDRVLTDTVEKAGYHVISIS